MVVRGCAGGSYLFVRRAPRLGSGRENGSRGGFSVRQEGYKRCLPSQPVEDVRCVPLPAFTSQWRSALALYLSV